MLLSLRYCKALLVFIPYFEKNLMYFPSGHIDHSARVMRVITWNRSFRGLANMDDGKDDFYAEEQETHATVLDKLLAWEKKLYDEVKVYGTVFILS